MSSSISSLPFHLSSTAFFSQANSTNVSGSTLNAVQGNQINNINFASLEPPPHPAEFKRFCDRQVAGAAFNSEMRSSEPKCLPNTRVGVRQAIRQWFDGAHDSPICWLRGPASSGKSAIAQTVAEEYDKSGELAASFFFDKESADRRDITHFVPTIAFHLSIAIPQTKTLMERAFERDPAIHGQTRQSQFKKLIVNPLLELGKVGEAVPRKIVIIDGLDQYEPWVEDLIVLLTDACQDDRFPLRFCITSRVDVAILVSSEAMERIYSMALEGFDARDDIRMFFEAKFNKIYRRHRGRGMRAVTKPWLSHSDINRLVTTSSSSFAVASIVVQFVDQPDVNDPYPKLQAILASLGDNQPAATFTGPHSFVDYLVHILASSDIDNHAAAIMELESVTKNGVGAAAVNANVDAIPYLIKLLQSTNESILTGVCRILVNIIPNVDSTRAASLNTNAVPLLVCLLSSNDILDRKPAMFALMKITLLGPAENSAPILEAVPQFVQLLDSQDTSIQASAAAMLQNITLRGGAEVVVKAKAIQSLVKLLNSPNSVILIVACTALKSITSISVSARAEASEVNAIPSLIPLLTSSDIRVQKPATFALMYITLHDCAKTAALASKAIPNLVTLLGSNDIQIQASAAAVLENITAYGRGAEDSTKAEAIPSLVKLLASSSDATVLIAVCAALNNITSTFEARTDALNAGAVPSLKRLSFHNDSRLRTSAKVVLENITLHDPSRTPARMSDTIMYWVESFTSSVTVPFLGERLTVPGPE